MADFLKTIEPMPAVFDQYYVKRLDGTNVKRGGTKIELGGADPRKTSATSRRRTAATAW